MNPAETSFWIVSFGLPILFLELLSLFAFIFLNSFIDYRDYKGYPFFFLVVIILLSFVFTFLFNILLFVYFLVSVVIKYFALRKIKTINENSQEIGGLGIASLSWLFAIFIAFFGSTILISSHPSQSIIIKEFIINGLPKGVEIVGDLPEEALGGFIMLWGVFYFSFSIIFNLVVFFINRRKS